MTPRTIYAAIEQRMISAHVPGKSKSQSPSAASNAVATCSPSVRAAARCTSCILGATPSSVFVGTTSAESSVEALPSLPSTAAALVEHSPPSEREKKIKPLSACGPSPALHAAARELSPSWASSSTNTAHRAAAAATCGTPSPPATARAMPTTTFTAVAC